MPVIPIFVRPHSQRICADPRRRARGRSRQRPSGVSDGAEGRGDRLGHSRDEQTGDGRGDPWRAQNIAEIPHFGEEHGPHDRVASRSRSPSPRSQWCGVFLNSSVRACRRSIHRANQQHAALGGEALKMGDPVELRQKRNRRLDVHGCRQDEGNYPACHPRRRVRRIAKRSSAGSAWTIYDRAAEQKTVRKPGLTGGNLCPAPPFFRLAQPTRKAIAYRNICRVF